MFMTPFKTYACDGDTIACSIDGLTCTATLYRDDDCTSPELRQDGFWPSLNAEDAGYIGKKSQRTLERQTARAKEILRAWREDEWFYGGLAVTVSKNGIELIPKYNVALWGIECNLPGTDNSYLLTVANELLPEAMSQARAAIASLCSEVTNV